METIGARIRHLRLQADLSMDELAKNILMPSKDSDVLKPTTSATISNIENGRNNPSADIIIALSDFFNVSTDWILKGKEFVKNNTTQDLYSATTVEEVKELYSTPQILKDIREMKSHIDKLNKAYKFIQENPSLSAQFNETITSGNSKDNNDPKE